MKEPGTVDELDCLGLDEVELILEQYSWLFIKLINSN